MPKLKGRGGSPLSQMNKVEMTHLQRLTELELKELITRSLESVVDKIKGSQKDLEELVSGKYDQLSQIVAQVASDLSTAVAAMGKKVTEISSKFEAQIQELQTKLLEAEAKNHNIQNDVIMLQIKAMEPAIRLRGIKEDNRENLRITCAKAFAELLKIQDGLISGSIEKVYRVNSRLAKQRNLPRDVVVYFTDKRLRDDILQKSYSERVHVAGTQIRIFKELPSKVLKDRKDFDFLVKELKRSNIPFRWDFPVGIIFRYHGVRHCLNTIEKAEYFYQNIFKGAPEYLKNKKSKTESTKCEQKEENQSVLKVKGEFGGCPEDSTMDFSDEKIEHLSDLGGGSQDLELLEEDSKNKVLLRDDQQQRSNTLQDMGGDANRQELEVNEEIRLETTGDKFKEHPELFDTESESIERFGKNGL